MSLYRYRITPLSAFATPLRSDTLYGHLLWAAAMLQGQTGVTDLIRAFEDGTPPFILSSAIPSGRLPMPSLPGIARGRFKAQFVGKGNLFEQLQRYKFFRKQTSWPLEQWLGLEGAISQETLFAAWLISEASHNEEKKKNDTLPEMATKYQAHVSIDRQSGAVLNQGGLFFSKGTWHRPGMDLDLYVQTEDPETFERLFRHIELVGYGADRTTGNGQFKFSRDTCFDAASFNVKGTHRLSLSVCASSDLGAFDGYWEPLIKHGRAWNGFGEQNPFKKPFFAFAEGSLFRRMPDRGYVLRNIHSNPAIVQVAWPLTIPVTLEGHHAD